MELKVHLDDLIKAYKKQINQEVASKFLLIIFYHSI
jgi:hypothetical protein